MSFYNTLCEISGSLSGNGNGHTSSNGDGYVLPGHVYISKSGDVVTGSQAYVEEYKASLIGYASAYNPNDIGIIPIYKNAAETEAEIVKQTSPKRNLPPSFTYEGPVGGGGPLGLFPAKPGSPEYNAYILKRNAEEKYNSRVGGVTSLPENGKTAADEEDKQTTGPGLWERFTRGADEGYEEKPEDENVFLKSLEDAKNAFKGIIPEAPNTNLLLIAGGVLLLILIIK